MVHVKMNNFQGDLTDVPAITNSRASSMADLQAMLLFADTLV